MQQLTLGLAELDPPADPHVTPNVVTEHRSMLTCYMTVTVIKVELRPE